MRWLLNHPRGFNWLEQKINPFTAEAFEVKYYVDVQYKDKFFTYAFVSIIARTGFVLWVKRKYNIRVKILKVYPLNPLTNDRYNSVENS